MDGVIRLGRGGGDLDGFCLATSARADGRSGRNCCTVINLIPFSLQRCGFLV